MVAATSSILPVAIVVALALVFGSVAVSVAILWDKTPWWRTTPKPKRVYKNAKEQVKTWKVMQKHPEAFPAGKVEDLGG